MVITLFEKDNLNEEDEEDEKYDSKEIKIVDELFKKYLNLLMYYHLNKQKKNLFLILL